jgi:cytochrome c oxidase subunit II
MTPLVRSVLLLFAAAAVSLATAATASGGNGGFAPVPPESPNAEGITQSWWFISVFVVAILVLVETLLITFMIRFRRRGRPRDLDGAQIHGASKLEVAWTVGPVLILFAIATFVLVKLPGISDVPTSSAAPSMHVRVTGQQYYWEYDYGNGVITVEQLRAPAGRVVELDVTAPDWDVIHSWWIPALGGKIDAIPGRVNTTWFEAGRPGVFVGQCAELCGLDHAKMVASVEVMPPAEFDSWLEQRRSEQEAGTSTLGQETYAGVCAQCHGLSGEGGIGPPLKGSALVSDPEAIETLLRTGRGVMPPVGRDWGDEQMSALTDYLGQELGSGS